MAQIKLLLQEIFRRWPVLRLQHCAREIPMSGHNDKQVRCSRQPFITKNRHCKGATHWRSFDAAEQFGVLKVTTHGSHQDQHARTATHLLDDVHKTVHKVHSCENGLPRRVMN